MTDTEILQNWVKSGDNIVFFGGAGVSTESGVPDFRSVDGLYHQKYKYPPETILSHSFFVSKPRDFYEYYKNKMLCEAFPNAAHLKLAELEASGKLKGIITQNIDGLHQAAGSKNVLELHGSIHRNYCTQCHRFYDVAFIKESTDVPICICGGLIKPDVVLYEEPLKEDVIERSVQLISEADVLIVGGTSLNVYPAAGLIQYYRGNKLVLINRSETQYDQRANLLIHDSIGKVLSQISAQ